MTKKQSSASDGYQMMAVVFVKEIDQDKVSGAAHIITIVVKVVLFIARST